MLQLRASMTGHAFLRLYLTQDDWPCTNEPMAQEDWHMIHIPVANHWRRARVGRSNLGIAFCEVLFLTEADIYGVANRV